MTLLAAEKIPPEVSPTKNLCTLGGQSSACFGDSGGGLYCKTDGNWVVSGVFSWMSTTCAPTLPSVYVNVAFYLDWIDRVMLDGTDTED